jgi:hypothetical protein
LRRRLRDTVTDMHQEGRSRKVRFTYAGTQTTRDHITRSSDFAKSSLNSRTTQLSHHAIVAHADPSRQLMTGPLARNTGEGDDRSLRAATLREDPLSLIAGPLRQSKEKLFEK